jgi:hypothetical protein
MGRVARQGIWDQLHSRRKKTGDAVSVEGEDQIIGVEIAGRVERASALHRCGTGKLSGFMRFG